jgi:3-deoxy-manno-octulosonate cytidylyltransferase (CMP-KDO synthetase)
MGRSPNSGVLAVIPARYGSTRLPAKPLADIHGKPMIQWVFEAAARARGVDRVVVATDDHRIEAAVQAFGGEAVLTSPEIASGTDRVAAVGRMIPAGIYANVQGDEPLITPEAIEAGIELVRSGRFPLGTVMTRLRTEQELRDPSVVKVVADGEGRALYFSRLPIPYGRGPLPAPGGAFACRRHVGLYVYRGETLQRFSGLAPSPLEKAEVLEQLRALENGIPIGVVEVEFTSIGVDTPEDLDRVRRLLV